MVDKARDFIPDSVKDAFKKAMEPLGKAEKAIETAGENLIKRAEKYDADEMRRIFDDLLVKYRSARTDVENALSSGLNKTLQTLNVPTRDELDVIRHDVARLSKDLRSLKVGHVAAPMAKKMAKKGR